MEKPLSRVGINDKGVKEKKRMSTSKTPNHHQRASQIRKVECIICWVSAQHEERSVGEGRAASERGKMRNEALSKRSSRVSMERSEALDSQYTTTMTTQQI